MTSFADWSRIQGAFEAGYNEFCILDTKHRALPPQWWDDKYDIGDYSPSLRTPLVTSSATVSLCITLKLANGQFIGSFVKDV